MPVLSGVWGRKVRVFAHKPKRNGNAACIIALASQFLFATLSHGDLNRTPKLRLPVQTRQMVSLSKARLGESLAHNCPALHPLPTQSAMCPIPPRGDHTSTFPFHQLLHGTRFPPLAPHRAWDDASLAMLISLPRHTWECVHHSWPHKKGVVGTYTSSWWWTTTVGCVVVPYYAYHLQLKVMGKTQKNV